MNKLKGLFAILFVSLSVNLHAQSITGTLNINVLQDITSYNLTQFANFSENFNLEDANTAVLISINITADVDKVQLSGNMYWQSPEEGGPSGEIFNFISDPIQLEGSGKFYNLIINNTDFGDGEKVDILEGNTDSDLIEENAKRGRLTGTYQISMILQDLNGMELARDEVQLVASNPSQSFSIYAPDNVTQEGFQLQWSPVAGRNDVEYIVVISEEQFFSKEEAVSGNPNVEVRVQAPITSIDPSNIDRAFSPGETYYLGVFAAIPVMFEGEDYYAADNNNMPISIPEASSGGGGSTGSTTNEAGKTGGVSNERIDPDYDEGSSAAKPTFSITEPLTDASFTITNNTVSLPVTWGTVTNATSYEIKVNFTGKAGSSEQDNARINSLTNKEVVPGQNIFSQNITGNNSRSVSVDISNIQNPDSSYLAVGVYANDPNGVWRSTNIVFVRILEDRSQVAGTGDGETGGDQQQQQQPVEEEISANDLLNELQNNPNANINQATDADGNSYSGDQIQQLLQGLENGSIEGTLRVIRR